MATNSLMPRLARELRRLPGKVWRGEGARKVTPLLVLLLTPKHIGLLDKLDDNLGAHLQNLYPEALHGVRHVDVLIAVVDRIPNYVGGRRVSSTEAAPNEGCEGVSLAYLNSSKAAPDLWASRQDVTKSETMSIQQRCTISFALCVENGTEPLEKLQLPVANTLFVNGRTSTLLAQRWVKHFQGPHEQPPSFTLMNEKPLPEQIINLTLPSLCPKSSLTRDLRSFLRPITTPRVVAKSVGNIVQSMHFDDGLKASPASHELEAVIQKIIPQKEIPSGPISVWAMIRPERLKEPYSRINRDALEEGCQVRKVLSGGGGWGVKQGLLSLDPDDEYGTSLSENQAKLTEAVSRDQVFSKGGTDSAKDKLPASDEVTNRQDLLAEGESPNMFEDLVKPGDSITFFVNRISRDTSVEPTTESDLSHPRQVAPPEMPGLFQFGSLPSTIDAPQPSTNELPEVELQEKAVIIPNYFGMLSEQGMSFEGPVKFPPSRFAEWQIEKDQRKRGLHSYRGKTKLDAPFTLFTWDYSGESNEER